MDATAPYSCVHTSPSIYIIEVAQLLLLFAPLSCRPPNNKLVVLDELLWRRTYMYVQDNEWTDYSVIKGNLSMNRINAAVTFTLSITP